eukprot:TRINITY_DN5646_c0_g1_i1.p1 TRINITY_DN5646_c0_g1~~TRINITY_DN5646_c0_g1_i1.p1  ORF type:complete len:358 (-),score=95.14 TRINITY_DN5646_c0_g1_i1:119-1192(-)
MEKNIIQNSFLRLWKNEKMEEGNRSILNPHLFLSKASEMEKLVFHGTIGMGIYEGFILLFILFIMLGSGRICNRLCGNYSNPKLQPMTTQVKHPGWSPKLRNIRSYFRYFYLIQAPAIWLIWLQMRWEQLPSSSPHSPFEPVSQLFNDEELPEQLIPIEFLNSARVRSDSYFPFLDELGPIWTQLIRDIFPGIPPFFSSPQLILFIIQFYLGLSWPVFFFRFKKVGTAALISIGVWLALNFTIRSFWSVSSTAAILLYSYLAWITTATALSLTIWFINLKKKHQNNSKEKETNSKDPSTSGDESTNSEINISKIGDKSAVKEGKKGCTAESDEEGEEDSHIRRRNPIHTIRHYFNGR